MTYKDLYIAHMANPKPVEFRGSSLDDLRDFRWRPGARQVTS